jgi:hypothetical protein
LKLAGISILATFLFLLGGGVGFLYFLEDWRKKGEGFSQFLTDQPLNYAHEGNLALYWDNVIVGQILPQRPSLYGMAIAFLVCILFAGVWRRWTEEKRGTKLTAGIDNHSHPARYRFTRDPGDERCRRSWRLPDADHARFTRDTRRTNIDVVTACGEVIACTKAHRDVE